MQHQKIPIHNIKKHLYTTPFLPIFCYQNQKGTSKKIIPGLYDPLYYNKPKKKKQKNPLGLYDPLYYDKPRRNKQKQSSQVYMIPYTIIN